jgi:hypothetical protein
MFKPVFKEDKEETIGEMFIDLRGVSLWFTTNLLIVKIIVFPAAII